MNCTIANNNASGNAGGLYILPNSVNFKLDNCIVWGNTCTNTETTKQLTSIASAPGSTILRNTCISNETGDISGATIDITATSNIYSNPIFISSTSDFRLQNASPCKNTGNNDLNATTTDIRGAGFLRIYDTTIDMGAYEINASDIISGIDKYIENDKSGVKVFTNSENRITVINDKDIVNANVKVYNTLGRMLENKVISESKTVLNKISGTGVYFVIISINGNAFSRKLIIN